MMLIVAFFQEQSFLVKNDVHIANQILNKDTRFSIFCRYGGAGGRCGGLNVKITTILYKPSIMEILCQGGGG